MTRAPVVELTEQEASMVLSDLAGGCPLFSGVVEIVGVERGALLWFKASGGVCRGDESLPDRYAACIRVVPRRPRRRR